MTWARTNDFLVLTNDLDFPVLLAHAYRTGPSVILMRGEPLTPEARGETLLLLLKQCAPQLAAGAVVSMDCGSNYRIRLLPL